jgi:hypothetical protein
VNAKEKKMFSNPTEQNEFYVQKISFFALTQLGLRSGKLIGGEPWTARRARALWRNLGSPPLENPDGDAGVAGHGQALPQARSGSRYNRERRLHAQCSSEMLFDIIVKSLADLSQSASCAGDSLLSR